MLFDRPLLVVFIVKAHSRVCISVCGFRLKSVTKIKPVGKLELDLYQKFPSLRFFDDLLLSI